MINSTRSSIGFKALREKAESLLKEEEGQRKDIDRDELPGLIHELEVHQIELELQNQELQRTKTELEASRDELADLYESAPLAYVTLDREGMIERANEAAHELLGHQNLLPGRPFSRHIDTHDLSFYYAYLNKLASHHGAHEPVELRLTGPRREPVYARLEATVKSDEKGILKHWRLAFVDITKRKKVEQELLAAEARARAESDRRRHLAERLVRLLEEDRRDTAMMLHDEIGQILTSVKMELEALETQKEGNPFLERITRAREKTADTLKTIKDIARQLRPSSLETLGIVPSVRSLIDRIRKSAGFDIHFFTKGISSRLGPEKELALYRILQEALTNAVKHSGADEVFVNLIQRDATVALTVEDDGKGFDYDRVSEVSDYEELPLGISIMRERAVHIGAEFRIESQPGKGTQVMVEVPL